MTPILQFDRFEVRTAERRLLDDGKPATLGSRAFDVLVWLIEHRERLVTKEELLEAVWPGLVVEENNLSVQVSVLRKILGPSAIVTVAGRGYRFAAEVKDGGAAMQAVPREPATLPVNAASVDERPAIAVLPFDVLSADPADVFLADGLAADVISLLARVPGFLMISRGSSFAFRGHEARLGDIARQLSVRYLVEGSVRMRGDAVRVSTQLTDAESGHVLWSGDFTSARDKADDLQEGIARGILSQLQPELTRAEIASVRRQRRENVDAWGHYHQAVGSIAENGWGESAVEEARSQLKLAMTADPAFGLAYAYYAVLSALGRNLGLVRVSPTLESDLLGVIDSALRLDGHSAEVLGYVGCALSDLGHVDRGIELLREAVEIDPSNAQAHVALGAALAQQGYRAEGIEEMRLGMRISPRDRRLGFWGWTASLFLLRDGRPDEALHEARIAETRDPRLYLPRIAQAVALARLGRLQESVPPLRRAMQLRPQLTLDEIALTHGKTAGLDLGQAWTQVNQAPR